MRTASFVLLASVVLACFLIGCGGGSKAPATPTETVKKVTTDLANNKPQVVWDSLPPSYQKDVDGVIKDFAGKMDPELYNQGFVLLQKVVKILETKKTYILNNPMLASVDKAQAEKNWSAVVQLPSILANSEISDLEKLKKLDVQRYLADSGAQLMAQFEALSKLAPKSDGKEIQDYKKTLQQTKATVVSQKGDTAQVKMEVPGQPATTDAWVKVEGRWIPKEMADDWKKKIKEAKDGIAKMETQIKNKAQALGQMKSIEGMLDQFLATKTEEEFNQMLNQTLMPLMMMLGGGMGTPNGGMKPAGVN